MATLNEQIAQLRKAVIELQNKVIELSGNTEGKTTSPRTAFGFLQDKSTIRPADVRSQMGGVLGGTIYWNDTEIDAPFGEEPELPEEGYHKHTHSRFSGGALIKNGLEIVEFAEGEIDNVHSQQFLEDEPKIATEERGTEGNKEKVKKIGLLDLVFNPNGGIDEEGDPIGTWGVAASGIDVEGCYFMKKLKVDKKDEYGYPIEGQKAGDIEKDENGNEKKSPLYVVDAEGNQDVASSSIIWDKNGRKGMGCWRLLATYAWSPEEEPKPEE